MSPAAAPVDRMLDLYRQGDEAASEALAHEIVEAVPAEAKALLMLGVFAARRGEHEPALEWLERAVQADAALAHAWVNRGHVLDALGRYHEAAASYRHAIARGRESAHVLARLASALARCGELDDALEALDRALALDPRDTDALYQRVDLLARVGRTADAIEGLRAARTAGADGERIDHALAALGAAPPPATSPTGYLRDLFDGYADRFESHLRDELGYRVPEQIADAVARLAFDAAPDVLDAGCGTGLCGPALRTLARHLEGVDLSPRMLERARRCGCYDALHCEELLAFLHARPSAYDLIVAGDVLIYFGDLAGPLAAAHDALRPGGRFVFNVEESTADAVVLNPSRRYAHTLEHLRERAIGWDVVEAVAASPRRERGVDVAGRIVVLRRAASAPSPVA